jgi:hypothetical protein
MPDLGEGEESHLPALRFAAVDQSAQFSASDGGSGHGRRASLCRFQLFSLHDA